MQRHIGFLTGARSEYGLAKPYLKAILEDPLFDLSVFPNGMHLLERFGNTVDEIAGDEFPIGGMIRTYHEEGAEKAEEFCNSVTKIYRKLKNANLDAVFLIGDRIEAYSAALAAHFCGIPVFHSGGGTLTMGAVDNIYRYNISNLASLHFATSRKSFDRLRQLPLVENENVFFTGSPAVDAIKKYIKSPLSIDRFVQGLKEKPFALITFHPVTRSNEPILDIMRKVLDYLSDKWINVLVTYPNNDEGHAELVSFLENLDNPLVHIRKSLGVDGYYTALNDCLFVLGNSSSGVIEAPYFHKRTINVGGRQRGRDIDACTWCVPAKWDNVESALDRGFAESWRVPRCEELYGSGEAGPRFVAALRDYFRGKHGNADLTHVRNDRGVKSES